MSGESDGADRGTAESDHLAALLFTPDADGSRGSYTPGTFDLHLDGGEDLADQLVHHHEVQHVALTATTAWGSALLVASRVPGWTRLFAELLGRCRITHESYATYLSCSVVRASLGSPAAALAAYPQYAPLAERLDQYVAAIPDDHRRSLAVTALARACMQTPILEQMAAAWPEPVPLSSVRAIDQPDERLSRLLRDRDGLSSVLVAIADTAVSAEFGPDPLAAAADPAGRAALDDRFDAAWAQWENIVFDALKAQLTGIGASVVSGNDHLPAAAQLVALASRVVPDLGVTVIADPDVSDQRMVATALSHARLWLSALRRPARMITAGQDIDVAEAVRVADATTRIGDRPNLVLQVRRPDQLLTGYDLPEDDQVLLAGLAGPVLVSRTIADDGTGQADALWLVRWDDPADVSALAALWGDRGDLTCCVAASCLADSPWRAGWLPALQGVAPIIWLIDVPIQALSQELGAEGTVYGIYLDLAPTATGIRRAVAFKVPGRAGTWLALADDVGVQLITQQVADLPGVDLQMTGADWTALLPALRLVLIDLLRTEPYVGLRALSAQRSESR